MRNAILLISILSACSFGDDLETIVVVDSVCGDGTVENGEACDDGNTAAGDGCSATCNVETSAAACGDGAVDTGEQCDDGNTTSGDGCSSSCRDEQPTDSCGDGVVAASEQCDDGNGVAGDGCSAQCLAEIAMFSEYVEGASDDKALELKSAGDAPFDFTGCELHLYSNGAATPSITADLTPIGMLAPDEVVVLCHADASAELLAGCDFTASAVINFNGDDALELTCDDVTQDVLGQIGFDPGAGWLGVVSTTDVTLRRDCDIERGDADGSDEFDGAGWVELELGDFSDLGLPTCED